MTRQQISDLVRRHNALRADLRANPPTQPGESRSNEVVRLQQQLSELNAQGLVRTDGGQFVPPDMDPKIEQFQQYTALHRPNQAGSFDRAGGGPYTATLSGVGTAKGPYTSTLSNEPTSKGISGKVAAGQLQVRMPDGSTQTFFHNEPAIGEALNSGGQVLDPLSGQPLETLTNDAYGGFLFKTAEGDYLPTNVLAGLGWQQGQEEALGQFYQSRGEALPGWLSPPAGQNLNPDTGLPTYQGPRVTPNDLLEPWKVPFEGREPPGFDPSSLPDVPNTPFEFDPSQIANDPGYQFMSNEIRDQVGRQNSAMGRFYSGATLREIGDRHAGLLGTYMPLYYQQQLGQHQQNYGQDVDAYNRGFQEWLADYGAGTDAYNRDLGAFQTNYGVFRDNQTQPFNMLTTLGGLGQVSASNTGAFGGQYGSNVSNMFQGYGQNAGNLALGAGDLRASGYVGRNNARQGFNPAANLQNLWLYDRVL